MIERVVWDNERQRRKRERKGEKREKEQTSIAASLARRRRNRRRRPKRAGPRYVAGLRRQGAGGCRRVEGRAGWLAGGPLADAGAWMMMAEKRRKGERAPETPCVAAQTRLADTV